MFSVLKITEYDRQALPEAVRGLPAYAVYESGKMTGYCVFGPDEDEAVIHALRADDPALADAALRTVLSNCRELTNRFGFSPDFSDWDMLPQGCPHTGGEIESYLSCCG